MSLLISSGIADGRTSATNTALLRMRQRRLIVNGDDFGASKEVNEAILRAFREGVLTSCSLMVTGEAFDHAVRLAKENPRLAVGIHLVTVMGKSVLPRSEIPSLVDEEGNFSARPVVAGLRYLFSKHARQELKKELAAQFEKFQSTGLPLSHIDSHLHMHVHPVIFRAALELGERYGVRRMRMPVEELGRALRFDFSHPFRKTVYAFLFRLLARNMKRKLRARGFVFSERVYGNLQTGQMCEDYFFYTVNHLHAETNEIYFHPAVYDPQQRLSIEQQQCVKEFEALRSKRVAERIAELGIKLTNYYELDVNR